MNIYIYLLDLLMLGTAPMARWSKAFHPHCSLFVIPIKNESNFAWFIINFFILHYFPTRSCFFLRKKYLCKKVGHLSKLKDNLKMMMLMMMMMMVMMTMKLMMMTTMTMTTAMMMMLNHDITDDFLLFNCISVLFQVGRRHY